MQAECRQKAELPKTPSFDDMFRQLETAIHQFAKRQMTWFRGMERRGFTIHWLDARMSTEEKVEKIMNLLDTKS